MHSSLFYEFDRVNRQNMGVSNVNPIVSDVSYGIADEKIQKFMLVQIMAHESD